MLNTNNAEQFASTPEQDAAARKAKAIEMAGKTGKVLGLLAVGAALAVGVSKFRNRNNDVTSA